ncbi:polysaccharide deacetylase family protein [Adhaeribacter terreus]|uniref:Polysaccharide deacetylase family protein n=1 Tax=Adhaeribacter terreus TaxID=529703 RepID=A0ABW0E6X2_9BACT
MKPEGIFVISLDFELFWGVRDVHTFESYGENILAVRKVVPALLQLFTEFDIHVTWSTVGFLFFRTKEELLRGVPEIRPDYTNPVLSPYADLVNIGKDENADAYHFGSSLIEQIKRTPHQEIGTHTFSHYYCLEDGQTRESFRADLQAAIKVAGQQEIRIESLVFPRNQYNRQYLDICAELGITCFRGNEEAWFYREGNAGSQTSLKRGARLLDAYLNVSGDNCYSLEEIARTYPYNIPASRFFRPYSEQLKFLEPLKVSRIKAGLTAAAKEKQVYHLWWHPHNFGKNLEENIEQLRQVLVHYKNLQQQYGIASFTMAEIAALIKEQYEK